jgi:hypothetical protein
MGNSVREPPLKSSLYLKDETASELAALCERWDETAQAAIARAVGQAWALPELELLDPPAPSARER